MHLQGLMKNGSTTEFTEMCTVLLGILGLGGMRTVAEIKGVAYRIAELVRGNFC